MNFAASTIKGVVTILYTAEFLPTCLTVDISLLSERFTMATISVQCPRCNGAEVIKAGKQPNGAQRYRCQKAECDRTIFQLAYGDKGRLPEIKRQIVAMALNGSGVRDTARVLGIGTGTVMNELKKKGPRSSRSTRQS
jgi:transposase-like protein